MKRQSSLFRESNKFVIQSDSIHFAEQNYRINKSLVIDKFDITNSSE
jgi:hypothetical protein